MKPFVQAGNKAAEGFTCGGNNACVGDKGIVFPASEREATQFPKNSSFFPRLLRREYVNVFRMVMAEMVGTFILMISVCGIIATTQLAGGGVSLMECASAAGFSIIVVIFAIGHISGAHVNPAVTVAFAVFSPFPWSRVPYYVLAQTLGAVMATYVGRSIYDIPAGVMMTRPLQSVASAFWVEFLATLIVVFSAASLLYESNAVGPLSGIVIGVVIGLGVLITGPISGGSMNPARSLGPAIVSWNFKEVWIYVIAPLLGALSGAFLYRLLRPKRRHRVAAPAATPSSSDPSFCQSLEF